MEEALLEAAAALAFARGLAGLVGEAGLLGVLARRAAGFADAVVVFAAALRVSFFLSGGRVVLAAADLVPDPARAEAAVAFASEDLDRSPVPVAAFDLVFFA